MDITHLPSLTAELLQEAHAASSRRAGRSIRSGRELSLRQTVLALVEGNGLDDHEANGEATLQVLVGHVRLRWGADAVELGAGDTVDIPDARHAVDALADSVLLLTVAVR